MYNINETWDDLPFNFTGDFLIGAKFGSAGVLDTYDRVIKEYRDAYKIFVRLIFDLNELCWFFHSEGRADFCKLFSELYYKAIDEFDATYENSIMADEAYKYYFEKLD